MGFKGKLRKALQQRREQRIYEKFHLLGLTQQCIHCKHFVYREEKPRNWVCRCPPEKMKWRGNVCLGWEYSKHEEMVVMHSR